MVGLPDFRSNSKSRPFATQPVLDHSNPDWVGFQIPTVNVKNTVEILKDVLKGKQGSSVQIIG